MDLQEFKTKVFHQLQKEKIVYIRAKITPSAPQTRFLSVLNDPEHTLKIAVSAPPEKNKANKKLCRFLSKVFHCQAEVVGGSKNTLKFITLRY